MSGFLIKFADGETVEHPTAGKYFALFRKVAADCPDGDRAPVELSEITRAEFDNLIALLDEFEATDFRGNEDYAHTIIAKIRAVLPLCDFLQYEWNGETSPCIPCNGETHGLECPSACLKWLCRVGSTPEFSEFLGYIGSVDLYNEAIARHSPIAPEIVAMYAAAHGHGALLRAIVTPTIDRKFDILSNAIGRVPADVFREVFAIMQSAPEVLAPKYIQSLIRWGMNRDAASEIEHLISANNERPPHQLFLAATVFPHLPVFRVFYEIADDATRAEMRGLLVAPPISLACIQYAAPTLPTNALELAAQNAPAELSRWLHSNGHPITQEALRRAAYVGNVELVAYFLAHKNFADADLAEVACAAATVPVLELFLAAGVPVSPELAREMQAPDCLRLLINRGVAVSPIWLINGNPEIVEIVAEAVRDTPGVNWPEYILRAISLGCPRILEILLRERQILPAYFSRCVALGDAQCLTVLLRATPFPPTYISGVRPGPCEAILKEAFIRYSLI